MTNYVYIATSLDGFIATKDGGIDWLTGIPNPENSDYGFAEFMRGIDAIVMGRNTFQTVMSFNSWPYQKPVFVLSNTLKTLPGVIACKAEIIEGNPREVVKLLRDRGFNNLYIDGGRTIQGFLAEDLIDEMIITRVPVLLGDGIPLFGKLSKLIKFSHIRTEIIGQGMVKNHYRRLRD